MSLPVYAFSEPITEPEILESIRQLPTEDDLPCDDGEPMETPRHRDQMMLLIESLKIHWSERSGYYVGGNMFVHYDPTNVRRLHGPDFFLVLDVDKRERRSWVVWQEGMRFPDVIIELLSDSTRADIEQVLREKKSFTLRCVLDCLKSFRGGWLYGTGARRASRSSRLDCFCNEGLRADYHD